MALIQWNDSLSVDVAEFDRQHQKLVSMINELNDAMSQGKGKIVLGKILRDLIIYTDTHFKGEEKLFDLHSYPDAASHKQEHAAFVKKVSDFRDGFESGKLTITIELMNLLSSWLQTHINGTDKKYTAFFNDLGVN